MPSPPARPFLRPHPTPSPSPPIRATMSPASAWENGPGCEWGRGVPRTDEWAPHTAAGGAGAYGRVQTARHGASGGTTKGNRLGVRVQSACLGPGRTLRWGGKRTAGSPSRSTRNTVRMPDIHGVLCLREAQSPATTRATRERAQAGTRQFGRWASPERDSDSSAPALARSRCEHLHTVHIRLSDVLYQPADPLSRQTTSARRRARGVAESVIGQRVGLGEAPARGAVEPLDGARCAAVGVRVQSCRTTGAGRSRACFP